MKTMKCVLAPIVAVLTGGAIAGENLPEGYKQLLCIESTGTQYIDTGVNAGANTTIDMSFGHCHYEHTATFFGKNVWDPKGFLFILQNSTNGKGYFRFFGKTGSEPGANWNLIERDSTELCVYRFVLGSDSTARLFDVAGNELCALATDRSSSSTHSLWLFKCDNWNSKGGKFRLYAMKIGTDDGALVRDFVPCLNEKGEAGLWDKVEGKFYGSEGKDQFIGFKNSATWTGGGDRTNLSDPANWECYDADGNILAGAIPDATATAVTVTGDTNFTFPADATPIWRSLTVGGTVNLTADCDWRGVGRITDFVAENTTIDLRGHELFARMPNDTPGRRINVTDSSAAGAGGRFHMDIPEGETFHNFGAANAVNLFWFSGSMELVKDGKGTYIPNRNVAKAQLGNRNYYTYTGGTTVHEGLLQMANDNGSSDYYSQKPGMRPTLGDYSSRIRVDAGATFDYNGVYDISYYNGTYLNGGTIKNTRSPGNYGYPALGKVYLEADSFYDFPVSSQQGGYFYLNGHTLTVNIAAGEVWNCKDGSGTNGTIIVRGGGTFCSNSGAINAPTVNFDIATAINMKNSMTVSNYVASYEGAIKHTGTQTMTVLGTFKPVTQNFYPCTLSGTPCIDLSEQTGAWNVAGISGEVKFAAGAVVTIDVGDRHLAQNARVVAWDATTKPTNLDTLTFRLKGRGGKIIISDDGLHVICGFTIRIAENAESIFVPEEFFDDKTVGGVSVITAAEG